MHSLQGRHVRLYLRVLLQGKSRIYCLKAYIRTCNNRVRAKNGEGYGALFLHAAAGLHEAVLDLRRMPGLSTDTGSRDDMSGLPPQLVFPHPGQLQRSGRLLGCRHLVQVLKGGNIAISAVAAAAQEIRRSRLRLWFRSFSGGNLKKRMATCSLESLV